jgi:hypothetical protein
VHLQGCSHHCRSAATTRTVLPASGLMGEGTETVYQQVGEDVVRIPDNMCCRCAFRCGAYAYDCDHFSAKTPQLLCRSSLHLLHLPQSTSFFRLLTCPEAHIHCCRIMLLFSCATDAYAVVRRLCQQQRHLLRWRHVM